MLAQSAVYFGIRVANGLLSLGLVYVFTRLLDPQEYGRFVLAMSGSTVVGTIGFGWLNFGVLRFFSAYQIGGLRHAVLKSFLFVTGVLVLLVAGGGAVWWCGGDAKLIVATGVGGVALASFNLSVHVANAAGRPLIYGALSTCRLGISIAVGALIALTIPSAEAVVWGMIAGSAVSAGLAGALLAAPESEPVKSEISVRELVNYGLPLSVSAAAISVVDVADRFLLAWFHGAERVASFAACYDLVQQSVGAVLSVFSLAVLPAIFRYAHEHGSTGGGRPWAKLGSAMLLMGPLAFIAATGFKNEISLLVSEPNRSGVSELVPWIALAIAIACFKSLFLDVVFQLHKATTTLMWISLKMAAVSVGLNLLLIPSWGAHGAAWASVGTFLAGALLSWRAGAKMSRVPLVKRDVGKTACASVLALAALAAVRTDAPSGLLFGQGMFAVLVYVVFTVAFNTCGCRTWLSERWRAQRGLRISAE